jgi:hypothetical protein
LTYPCDKEGLVPQHRKMESSANINTQEVSVVLYTKCSKPFTGVKEHS